MSDESRAMAEWVTAVRRELGLEGSLDVDGLIDTVLDLTGDVAHGVSRPAAPVTAFLVGLAAGRAADVSTAVTDHAGVVSRLAEGWAADSERGAAADEQTDRA